LKYRTAAAFRAALEERLRERAERMATSLSRLRKQVVFDRVLARLIQVAPDRWILKGALALDLRLPARARATKGMDLGRWDGETQATTDLLAATALNLGDFFALRSERARDLDDVPEGAAVRYRVRAELAGRLFEEVIVDVGFSPRSPPRVETVHTFDLLAFADIVGVDVPVIPLARHLAEKVHAYTRTYGDGRTSTRVKDLADMVLVALSCSLEGAEVRDALETTFTERSSHLLPEHLPRPPGEWGRPYSALAKELDLPAVLDEGYGVAARLVDPVLRGSELGRWDPDRRQWMGAVTT
jgi:hypothetical protein